MKQLSLAETGFLPKRGKVTRKAEFLAEMNTVVPWSRLEGLIEPVYPKAGRGRRPTPLSVMLRIYLMQHWFGYRIRRDGRSVTTFRSCASLLAWTPSKIRSLMRQRS